MRMEHSSIVDNTAEMSGGAIQVHDFHGSRFSTTVHHSLHDFQLLLCTRSTQVESGSVDLLNMTLLEQNVAPDGEGSSIHLASSGSLQYTLPTPPAHYLFIRQGDTFELKPGAEDAAFPYLCPAGVVGGTSPEEQSGPGCSRPW